MELAYHLKLTQTNLLYNQIKTTEAIMKHCQSEYPTNKHLKDHSMTTKSTKETE